MLDERLQEISQKASQVASKPLPQPTPKPVVLFEPPIIQSKTLTPRAIPTKEDFPVETAAEHSDDDEEEEKIPTFTMENESAPLRTKFQTFAYSSIFRFCTQSASHASYVRRSFYKQRRRYS